MDRQINPSENPKSIRINCGMESRGTARECRQWRGAAETVSAWGPEQEIGNSRGNMTQMAAVFKRNWSLGEPSAPAGVNRAGYRSSYRWSEVEPLNSTKHRLFLDKQIDEMAYTNRDRLAANKRLMT
jgi:hypothetical protein